MIIIQEITHNVANSKYPQGITDQLMHRLSRIDPGMSGLKTMQGRSPSAKGRISPHGGGLLG